jgi:hypothetical protein
MTEKGFKKRTLTVKMESSNQTPGRWSLTLFLTPLTLQGLQVLAGLLLLSGGENLGDLRLHAL